MAETYKYWHGGVQEGEIGKICVLATELGSATMIIVHDPDQNLAQMTSLPENVIPVTLAEDKIDIIERFADKVDKLIDEMLIMWPGDHQEAPTVLKALYKTNLADWLAEKIEEWCISQEPAEEPAAEDGDLI